MVGRSEVGRREVAPGSAQVGERCKLLWCAACSARGPSQAASAALSAQPAQAAAQLPKVRCWPNGPSQAVPLHLTLATNQLVRVSVRVKVRVRARARARVRVRVRVRLRV